jgi:hypothetical protein
VSDIITVTIRHENTPASAENTPGARPERWRRSSMSESITPLRRCTRCGAEKPLTSFYRKPDRPNGYSSHCKSCINAYEKQRVQDPEVRARKRADHRASYRRNRECVRQRRPPYDPDAAAERYARRRGTPEQRARSLISGEVQSGRIVKPHACQDCEARGPVQAHHEDYSRPLDVMWLCTQCHGKRHRKDAEGSPEENRDAEARRL